MPLDLNGPLFEEVMKREVEKGGASPAPVESEGIGKLAPAMWLGGGAADIASTIHGMQNGMQEANPMVNWAPKGAQIPLGIGMELGGVLLAKKLLGEKHPGIVKALMMGLGGLHGGLALKNMAATSSAYEPIPPPSPQGGNQYVNPNGGPIEYRNPEFFPGAQ